MEQSIADGFLHGALGFVLRHALQPANRSDAGQHPRELGMSGNAGLHDDGGMFWIDPDGDENSGELLDLLSQLGGILVQRDRVQIDDAENAVIVILDCHPILECPQVVSDVWISGGLDSGKDSCFHA